MARELKVDSRSIGILLIYESIILFQRLDSVGALGGHGEILCARSSCCTIIGDRTTARTLLRTYSREMEILSFGDNLPRLNYINFRL